jgi:tetratricopeptide (TPR) repeat protein
VSRAGLAATPFLLATSTGHAGRMSEADLALEQNRQGIALARQGRFDESVAYFHEALRLRPDYADAHCNLGSVLTFQGRYAEAVASYEQALRLQPEEPVVLNNLSNALRHLGRLDEAVTAARRALARGPEQAGAYNNLGSALLQQEHLDEAAACFRRAVALAPSLAEAHGNLAETLRRLHQPAEAAAAAREALRLRPDFAEAHHHLGLALLDAGQVGHAVVCFQEALRLRPGLADVWLSLAHGLWQLGRTEEGEACCREALARRPDFAPAYASRGALLSKLGQIDAALASYEQALRLDPNLAGAHFHRGMLLLLRGNFAEGWAEYEWRYRYPAARVAPLPGPAWDGSPLDGRTLLLHPEQGLGDTLQFIRYAPLIDRQRGRVLLACPPALVALLGRFPGLDGLVTPGDTSGAHIHAGLLGLPRLLGTTPETVPAAVPYLSADPALVEHWRRELAGVSGYRIGIAWQGSRHHPEDRFRSLPLAQFEPVARLPGVRLVSLQVGEGSEQVGEMAGRFEVLDLSATLDRTAGAFMDTAAVMKNLDLVITSDTAIAHLAGGLAVPVWVALPFAPDWRWLLDRADSPWYPTMRLFRQRRPGDWDEVFARLAQSVEEALVDSSS